MLWLLFFLALIALAVASGVALRMRLRERLGGAGPRVDDQAIRSILDTGVLISDEDEPLDLNEIEEEERRFWSESWDDPDEW